MLLLALLLLHLASAKRLGGMGYHFLVLQHDGQVFAVGRNECGQLGIGTTTNAALPRRMLSVTNASDVSAGTVHSCVLDQGSQAKSTGYNRHYELGDGTDVDKNVLVPSLGLVDEVYCGYSSSCARTTSGQAQCWGRVAGFIETSPITITLSGGIQSISQGYAHLCFVATVGGKLYCLGANGSGQLGGSTPSTVPTPVVNQAAENIVSVACGYQHTCAVNAVGAMFCWGKDAYGQLGNTQGAASAWTGWYNSFALMQNGTVQVFGRDGYGLFGTGGKTAPNVYGQGVSGVVEVRGGYPTTCVLLRNDRVWCTGNNLFGQLGVGSTVDSLTLVEMQLRPLVLTRLPTAKPTKRPTKAPTTKPTKRPTKAPTKRPTKVPTNAPTNAPTKRPTKTPTTKPTTKTPTKRPTTNAPTKKPTTAKPANL